MESILNRLIIKGGREDGLDSDWTVLAHHLRYNDVKIPMAHGFQIEDFSGFYQNGLCFFKTEKGLLFNMFTVENSNVCIDTAILFDSNTYEVIQGVYNCFALGFRKFTVTEAKQRMVDLLQEYSLNGLEWSEDAGRTATPYMTS